MAGTLMTSDTDVCGDGAGPLCDWVLQVTSNSTLASGTEWLVMRPLQIIGILLGAWVIKKLLVNRVRALVTRVLNAQPEMLPLGGTLHDPRRETRAAAISAVLAGVVGVAVWAVAIMMVAGRIGLELGPLLAGAGIVGLALGFGSQSLVRDWISGLFMLMEDQYGIGDVVDLGAAVGTVERFSLRATVIRSLNGTVWHIPNGEITRVGNLSQVWSVALVEVDVAYRTDLDLAIATLERTATEVTSQGEISESVLEPPVVTGVEQLGNDGITLRITVKTAAGSQWALQRLLRKAIKENFEAEGIEIPFPQRDVWIRGTES